MMDDPRFQAGEVDVDFLTRHGSEILERPPRASVLESVAIAAALAEHEARAATVPIVRDGPDGHASAWLQAARRSALR